jgi:hypothetical protein
MFSLISKFDSALELKSGNNSLKDLWSSLEKTLGEISVYKLKKNQLSINYYMIIKKLYEQKTEMWISPAKNQN